jgi:hypothetical protein
MELWVEILLPREVSQQNFPPLILLICMLVCPCYQYLPSAESNMAPRFNQQRYHMANEGNSERPCNTVPIVFNTI